MTERESDLLYAPARQGYALLDDEGMVVDATPVARELLGLESDQDATQVSEFPPGIRASLAGGEAPWDLPSDPGDGGKRASGQIDVDVFQVDGGEFSGHLLALREDGERGLSRRYEAILEASGDGVYTLDPQGDYTYTNQTNAELLGYDAAEMIGMSVEEILDEEVIERIEGEIRELLEEEGPGQRVVEHEVITRDGERVPVENHISLLFDGDGEFRGTAGVVRDVTERNEREEQLERYERIVETMGDGVYAMDAEGQYTMVNDQMLEINGYDREVAIDAGPELVHDEEDIARFEAAIRDLIAAGGDGVRTVEATLLTADGAEVPIEVNLTILTGEDGEFRGSVGVVRDVSERKERERELEQYETIVETVPEGVAVIDEEGSILSANRTAARMLGYEPGEFVGGPLDRLVEDGVVDEPVVETYLDTVRELLSSDTESARFDFEATVDGETRIFETQLAPRPYEDDFRGVVATIRDVTERRERRLELERYETVLDVMPDTVVVTDMEGRNLEIHGFEGWSGYEKDELIGEDVSFTATEEDIERAREAVKELLRNDDIDKVTYEQDIITKDGERVPHENHLALLPPDEDGTVPGTISVFRDVSEQKEREHALHTLHEATREMVTANSKDAIAEIAHEAAADVLGLTQTGVHLHDVDADALVPVAWTSSLEEELGEPPSLGPGSLAWSVFEDGETVRVADLREREGIHNPDTPFRSEMLVPLGEHGVIIFASTSRGAFDDEDQRFAEVLCSNASAAMDRVSREEDLRQRERELERKNEQLEQFASVLSHDLRNPLNVAHARVKNVLQTDDTEKLDSADQALARMNDLIEDLLTLAREGRVVGQTERVSLAEVTEEAWRSVEAPAASLSVAEGVAIDADRARLCELFENLFRNALEHAGQDVDVRVGRLGDEVPGRGFYVEDDGPGIPTEDRERVFESGYTTSGDGTGFGLAIVETIAQAHGWSVEVAEGADGGARFEFATDGFRDVAGDDSS